MALALSDIEAVAKGRGDKGKDFKGQQIPRTRHWTTEIRKPMLHKSDIHSNVPNGMSAEKRPKKERSKRNVNPKSNKG